MKKIYPVIHFKNLKTTLENVQICLDAKCDGVFLINMECPSSELNPAIDLARFMGGKDFFVGVNRLEEANLTMSEFIKNDKSVDGIWIDNPGLYSDKVLDSADYLTTSLNSRKLETPEFNLFGSVAFKTQKKESNPAMVARFAKDRGWIPTTSGVATGVAADLDKIKSMKEAIGDWPLAIASGITPENVEEFLPYIDYFLVATGISTDFHNLNREKVFELVAKVKSYKS